MADGVPTTDPAMHEDPFPCHEPDAPPGTASANEAASEPRVGRATGAPCTAFADGDAWRSQASKPASPPPELAMVLHASGRLKLRACGLCMYPAIHPGDVLLLDARDVGSLAVGDVAVARHDGRFLGHRVTRTGFDAQGPFFYTRPDRIRTDEEGPCRGRDLLGVVGSLERRGRPVPVSRRPRDAHASWTSALGLTVWRVRHRLARSGVRLLASAQGLRGYRPLAKRLLLPKRGERSFLVRVPAGADAATGLSRAISTSDVEGLTRQLQPGGVNTWTLCLQAHGGIIASATFEGAGPGCPRPRWWLGTLNVRMRHRGLGLEQALLAGAARIIHRVGGEGPRVLVPRDDAEAADGARRLGFVPDEGSPASGCPRLADADLWIHREFARHE